MFRTNILSTAIFTILVFLCNITRSYCDTTSTPPPDTVLTGIYITSIHDIDFKQKEFSINFWLWFKYKNQEFDFVNHLEIPNAKTVEKSFSTIDTSNEEVYLLMKMQCVMKDSWKTDNFPFDYQRLRIFLENSQYDATSLVFAPDTSGKFFDPRFTLRGWTIDSFVVSVGVKEYQTAFGDSELETPQTEYSSFRVRIGIERDAMGLFWKMFLGMYIAFLIAYVCFYIHIDGIDSRFGLSVGALFAVVGNKYIIDSSLPESTTFTLVDMLHGVTLFFILAVIISTAWSFSLVKKGKVTKARKFDLITAQIFLVIYLLLNWYFISQAANA